MKHILSFVLLLFFTGGHVIAQKEGNIWVFGVNAGLDFNSGSPIAIKTNLNQAEGIASVSDAAGRLLFYSNGMRIWNRDYVPMPNGSDLVQAGYLTASTTQAALIAPIIDSAGKYYLFSLTQATGSPSLPKLYLSVVDMNLDQGRGDVIAGRKAMLVDSILSEKMTVVAGDHCNLWLLLYAPDANVYRIKAYEITAAGISNTPVISTLDPYTIRPGDIGVMKVSRDRRRIVVTRGETNKANGVELYDFDPATGQVSNRMEIAAGNEAYYGACFAPGNNKLYITTENGNLYQYDVSLSGIQQIQASVVYLGNGKSDIKAGPDGKLYLAGDYGTDVLSVIHFPDNAGIACQFQPNALSLYNRSTRANFGFPNEIHMPLPLDTVVRSADTVICTADSILLQIDSDAWAVMWNDGYYGSSRVVRDSGLYTVQYRTGCTWHIDSFRVRFPIYQVSFAADTALCLGVPLQIENTSTHITTWSWDFGDQATLRDIPDPEHTYREQGVYTITLTGETAEGCTDTATSKIRVVYFDLSLTTDSLHVNKGGEIILRTEADEPYTVTGWYPEWFFSDQQAVSQTFTADSSRSYQVTAVSRDGCLDTASVRIIVRPRVYLPSAFTPDGNGRNDHFRLISSGAPVRVHTFMVYDRWGQLLWAAHNMAESAVGWDGMYHGEPAPVGVYFYATEIETESGDRMMLKGDITLIR